MIALLTCRKLPDLALFRRTLSVHFDDHDFAEVKESFDKWRLVVRARVPAKYRQGVIDEAEKGVCTLRGEESQEVTCPCRKPRSEGVSALSARQ